jgi:hypothetical protein
MDLTMMDGIDGLAGSVAVTKDLCAMSHEITIILKYLVSVDICLY